MASSGGAGGAKRYFGGGGGIRAFDWGLKSVRSVFSMRPMHQIDPMRLWYCFRLHPRPKAVRVPWKNRWRSNPSPGPHERRHSRARHRHLPFLGENLGATGVWIKFPVIPCLQYAGTVCAKSGTAKNVKWPSPLDFLPSPQSLPPALSVSYARCKLGFHQVLSGNCNSFRSYPQHKPASTLRRYGCSTKWRCTIAYDWPARIIRGKGHRPKNGV